MIIYCLENYVLMRFFFAKLKKFQCKHLVSIGAKFYGKENYLKKYLNIYKNISLIPLNEIYEFEKIKVSTKFFVNRPYSI